MSVRISIHSGAFAWAIASRSPSRSSLFCLEQLRELGHRLLAAANPPDRLDHPVADREDRLDVEERPGECLGLADPPALLEVLERVDREHDAVLVLEPLDERLDGLVGRALLESAIDRLGEQRAGERRGLGVHDADEVAAQLLGGPHRGLVRPRQLRREVERPDARVPGGAQLLVAGEEIGRGRLGGRRERLRARPAARRTPQARCRRGRGAPPRRRGRRAGRSACSGAARARRRSRTSSRGRSPCCRASSPRRETLLAAPRSGSPRRAPRGHRPSPPDRALPPGGSPRAPPRSPPR